MPIISKETLQKKKAIDYAISVMKKNKGVFLCDEEHLEKLFNISGFQLANDNLPNRLQLASLILYEHTRKKQNPRLTRVKNTASTNISYMLIESL